MSQQQQPSLVIAGRDDAHHTKYHEGSWSSCAGCREYPIMAHDMRRPAPYPEPDLVEAPPGVGVSYVSGPFIGPDGRQKYTVAGDPRVVEAWMDVWAPRQGLVDLYGDPQRGFAGGYIPHPASQP